MLGYTTSICVFPILDVAIMCLSLFGFIPLPIPGFVRGIVDMSVCLGQTRKAVYSICDHET
jgi:hypothetical protein